MTGYTPPINEDLWTLLIFIGWVIASIGILKFTTYIKHLIEGTAGSEEDNSD